MVFPLHSVVPVSSPSYQQAAHRGSGTDLLPEGDCCHWTLGESAWQHFSLHNRNHLFSYGNHLYFITMLIPSGEARRPESIAVDRNSGRVWLWEFRAQQLVRTVLHQLCEWKVWAWHWLVCDERTELIACANGAVITDIIWCVCVCVCVCVCA